GEVFIANRHDYKRIHHIKPFKLIGGEKAVKNPANMAVALIDEELAKNYPNYKIAKALNNASFPLTSSMGRVFDMVAFLAGMIEKNEWEGISGLLIEKYYNPEINEKIELKIEKEIDFRPVLNFAAANRGEFERVSSVFINTLVDMIEKIAKIYDLPVIVGGGVFQNKTLLGFVNKRLNPYFNKKIPINDGGVSVGQAAWGIWNLK
ncbi:Kae1-like domain-containing protein, partial [Caminibacter pacificus]